VHTVFPERTEPCAKLILAVEFLINSAWRGLNKSLDCIILVTNKMEKKSKDKKGLYRLSDELLKQIEEAESTLKNDGFVCKMTKEVRINNRLVDLTKGIESE
jgi:hypothetical protein